MLFCQIKEQTDDIELLLQTIEGSPEISSKPIYPYNSVWASGLLINIVYGRGITHMITFFSGTISSVVTILDKSDIYNAEYFFRKTIQNNIINRIEMLRGSSTKPL